MPTPAEQVDTAFTTAYSYGAAAQEQMELFVEGMTNALFNPPTVDISWTPVEVPLPIAVPPRPAALDTLESEFTWDETGDIALSKPAAPDLTAPTVVIDDFTDVAPTISYPAAPTVTYGTVPTIPAVGTVTVPTAPTIDEVTAPTLLTLSVPAFAGIDLHATLQTPLETMPALVLAAPTGYSYTPGAEYTSTLLTALKSKLETRLAGGTGLDPAVEAAIWDRARDREVAAANADITEATRLSESQGFQLPTGVLAQQLRAAQVRYYDKVSGLNRDVAIKQADLEQANLRETITAGLAMESKLIDYSWQLEQLAFNSAKTLAENAIAVYNAQVEKFKTTVDAYRAYASAYDTIIKAELALIEELKAKIALEQAKADFNRAAVDVYRAQIEAGMQRVKVYEAQVSAAQTLVSLEKTKIEAAGEQIRGFVAQVNAETAKVEAYKAGVQAELGKVQVFEAQARAFAAKSNAQAEKARAELGYYEARIRAYSAEWDGWRARVGGEAERFRALAAKSSAVIDGYRAQLAGYDSEASQAIKRWEVQIREYQAQAEYTMNGQKLNAELFAANRAALLDAQKTAAQMFAQMTASAWGIIHASAGVSANASNSVGWSYSNDTATAPASVTAV